jgi:type I restriction enzyme M protein
MAIILPHGVLFRGGAEARIRTKLLKDGHIDTVIGLPAKLFFSTGIPVCIFISGYIKIKIIFFYLT